MIEYYVMVLLLMENWRLPLPFGFYMRWMVDGPEKAATFCARSPSHLYKLFNSFLERRASLFSSFTAFWNHKHRYNTLIDKINETFYFWNKTRKKSNNGKKLKSFKRKVINNKFDKYLIFKEKNKKFTKDAYEKYRSFHKNLQEIGKIK